MPNKVDPKRVNKQELDLEGDSRMSPDHLAEITVEKVVDLKSRRRLATTIKRILKTNSGKDRTPQAS